MTLRQSTSLRKHLSQDMEPVLTRPAAERSVLGAILLLPSAYACTKVLQLEDFASSSNRIVYRCMRNLAETSRPIDSTTVVEELRQHGQLEGIGGAEYVSGLLDDVPDNANVQHYVMLLREATGRRLLYRLTESIPTALTQESSLQSLLALIDKELEAPRRLAQEVNRRPVTGSRVPDGAMVLSQLVSFLRRFVVLSNEQATVVALWIVHTHAFAAADATPYMAITSAEKQSGKTRLLEILELLVAKGWLTGRVTPAVLVRKIDAEGETLLLDETDAAFKGEKEYSEALRGVLNSGHRRGGKTSLCVGKGADMQPKDFHTFCPKALAGIGDLPDTVADRSISIRLKRKAPGEGQIERFRYRAVAVQATPVREAVQTWADTNLENLRLADPKFPDGLTDRQEDCVEPLLAIADAAGSEWPDRTRRALIKIFAGPAGRDSSIPVRLLADIQQIFGEREVDRLSTRELLEGLLAIETSPWAEYNHGKPLSPTSLAKLLSRFGIAPRTIRVREAILKGYDRVTFEDAWTRYLKPTATSSSVDPRFETQQPSQCSVDADETRFSEPPQSVLVTDRENEVSPVNTRLVTAVSVQTPQTAGHKAWALEGEI